MISYIIITNIYNTYVQKNTPKTANSLQPGKKGFKHFWIEDIQYAYLFHRSNNATSFKFIDDTNVNEYYWDALLPVWM